MAWLSFEILINVFQAFLTFRFIKGCFPYPRKTHLADVLLVTGSSLSLTIYLFMPSLFAIQYLILLFPFVHALLFSSEEKVSVVFWILVLILLMNLLSIITYPIFDLLPALLHFQFPSYRFERFLCIIATNILLFFFLEGAIRIKQRCTSLSPSSYIVFILMLAVILFVESTAYTLYLSLRDRTAIAFFYISAGMLACTALSLFLFYKVSCDAQREHFYQAQISMLNLSKQHQVELSQMYAELTKREHDYKHHLQTLQSLVEHSASDSAQRYVQALANRQSEMFVTGSLSMDALLSAKSRIMKEKGIQFIYSPYPLADLPVPTLDLCCIVGNLLDNAIEGVLRIPGLNTKQVAIHLAFSRSWDMFYIYCENPCDPSTIFKHKDEFLSSKTSGHMQGLHGIGIHSIRDIAQRFSGRTEFSIEHEHFFAKIVLPYPDNGGPENDSSVC